MNNTYNQIDMNLKLKEIKTWKKFAKIIRPKGCHLLKNLDMFQNSILVTGCQRSGTTILSRIITKSEGMVNYWFGRDDELDAALILSGYVSHKPSGRYCFQTTYLNECYNEYLNIKAEFKMIWITRNPFSVVYSMLYNWKNFALNELFESCGIQYADEKTKSLYKRFGKIGVSRLKKACLAYNGKVRQLIYLKKKISKESLIVLDYDEMVSRKNDILPMIYKYIQLPYKNEYANMLHSESINKINSLSKKERSMIDEYCMPIYNEALMLVDIK